MELTRPKIESRDPIFFTGTRSRSRVSGNDRLFPRGSEFGPNLEIPAGPAIQLRPGPGQGLRQLFPKVGMTIENTILKVLVEGFVSPILQIGDNGRCESGSHFSVEYRHHLRPRMDGIVGKTYQTYNSLLPCQEIDISCHKLSQNGDFVSKYPSSAAAILKLRFRNHVTPIF